MPISYLYSVFLFNSGKNVKNRWETAIFFIKNVPYRISEQNFYFNSNVEMIGEEGVFSKSLIIGRD